MNRKSDATLDNEMRQLESRLATMRERIRKGKELSAKGFENQVRTLEDQFDYFKADLEKKKIKSNRAYSELSEATKKAWDELWTGVHKAYKQVH